MSETRTVGGFVGDPAQAFSPPAAGGCCGSAAGAPSEATEAVATCCGTAAAAEAEGSCCGTVARAEAVETGAGCCG